MFNSIYSNYHGNWDRQHSSWGSYCCFVVNLWGMLCVHRCRCCGGRGLSSVASIWRPQFPFLLFSFQMILKSLLHKDCHDAVWPSFVVICMVNRNDGENDGAATLGSSWLKRDPDVAFTHWLMKYHQNESAETTKSEFLTNKLTVIWWSWKVTEKGLEQRGEGKGSPNSSVKGRRPGKAWCVCLKCA